MPRYEVCFADNGVHDDIIKTIDAVDWDEINAKADKKCAELATAHKLHQPFAYVGYVKLLKPK